MEQHSTIPNENVKHIIGDNSASKDNLCKGLFYYINRLSQLSHQLSYNQVFRDCHSWQEAAATFYMLRHPHLYLDQKNYFWYQKCIRPEDGNLYEVSDRKAVHHQFQILLKDCKDPLYLVDKIIKHLSLDETKIEIKIDNWNNRIIGCYGKGWDVSYKGVEIMQITYIDKVWGSLINKSCVEYAIGLERLALLTNKNYNYFDLYENKKYRRYIERYNHLLVLYIDSITEIDLKLIQKMLIKLMKDRNFDTFLHLSHIFNIYYATKQLHYTLRVKLIQTIYRIGKCCLE